MPFLSHGGHRIRYELNGLASGPAYVLVNGLTQYAELWLGYRETLAAKNFRVLTFDLLGQGESDKPSLFINQDDQVAAIRALVGSATSPSALPCSVWRLIDGKGKMCPVPDGAYPCRQLPSKTRY